VGGCIQPGTGRAKSGPKIRNYREGKERCVDLKEGGRIKIILYIVKRKKKKQREEGAQRQERKKNKGKGKERSSQTKQMGQKGKKTI